MGNRTLIALMVFPSLLGVVSVITSVADLIEHLAR